MCVIRVCVCVCQILLLGDVMSVIVYNDAAPVEPEPCGCFAIGNAWVWENNSDDLYIFLF